jgi:hypothetical protein
MSGYRRGCRGLTFVDLHIGQVLPFVHSYDPLVISPPTATNELNQDVYQKRKDSSELESRSSPDIDDELVLSDLLFQRFQPV